MMRLTRCAGGLSGLILFCIRFALSQTPSAEEIVLSMHSRVASSDSLLRNYQLTAIFSEIEFNDGQELVKNSQKQTRRIEEGTQAEKSFSFTLGRTDNSASTGEKRSGRFIHPLDPFDRPELYEFKRLPHERSDEVRLHVSPKEPEDIKPEGTYYFSSPSLRLQRAELKPTVSIEHVDEANVEATFDEFRGFPVQKSMTTRLQGRSSSFSVSIGDSELNSHTRILSRKHMWQHT